MRTLLLLELIFVMFPSTVLAFGGLFIGYSLLLESSVNAFKVQETIILAITIVCSLSILSLWILLIELYKAKEYLSEKARKYSSVFSFLGGCVAVWAVFSLLLKSIYGFNVTEVFHMGVLFSPGIPMLIPLIHYFYLIRKS